MGRIRDFWNRTFDVREGEGLRTLFMALYLLLVLLAYYILKPVSRAMFLNKFDIDELPYLYIVIAAAGGVMAYFYTKFAIHSSLKTAVNVCTFGMIGVLVLIWHLLTTTGRGCCTSLTHSSACSVSLSYRRDGS